MVLRAIASVLLWLIRLLREVLKWAVGVSAIGLWFGFWHFVVRDAARMLVPFVLREATT